MRGANKLNEIIDDMMSLGYSENEAKTYIALHKNPGISGYETSKQSGVPRSKVYEVLDGLVEKGAVMQMEVDGRMTYRPLPHDTLVDKHRRQIDERLENLGENLDVLPTVEDQYNFSSITDADAIIARAQDMLNCAENVAFISCWPEEFERLDEDIEAVRKRGVTVIVLLYKNHPDGVGKIGPEDVFYHTVTDMQHEQVRTLGRWLMLAVDNRETIFGQMRGDDEDDDQDSVALCCKNRLFAFVISQAISHDITVLEAYRATGSQMHQMLGKQTWRTLQRVQMAAAGAEIE